jgi:hypothetical protein
MIVLLLLGTLFAIYFISISLPSKGMYVFVTSNPNTCGTYLTYHREYFLRVTHVTNVDFTMTACDYRELTSSAKTTTAQLACGRSLAECDRYPCEASRPCSNSGSRIVCNTPPSIPCPQRVCGTSVCTGVVCMLLTLTLAQVNQR